MFYSFFYISLQQHIFLREEWKCDWKDNHTYNCCNDDQWESCFYIVHKLISTGSDYHCVRRHSDRWFLRICNTNRNAGQHHGSNGRRIYVQGLCESRYSYDRSSNHSKYDLASNLLSILPINIRKYLTSNLHKNGRCKQTYLS